MVGWEDDGGAMWVRGTMIGSFTSENVVSQNIERASLGGCSLMGLFNKKKVVRREKKKKRDQDLEIREDWKKETVKVFYSRAPLPFPLFSCQSFSRDRL